MTNQKGESCPGETKCSETPGKPLHKFADQAIEIVCKGCPLFTTKPENTPDELARFVEAGLMFSELESAGATFAYPDALEAWEWMSLTALARGRHRADKAARKREEAKPKK